MDSESLEKGRQVLQELRAGKQPAAGTNVTEEMSPDFWGMTQGHLFGEVWSRPGLPLRDRSLVTMVVLTTLGRMDELKLHMGYALNIGISKEEILEMLMHVAHYAGWPASVSALRTAKEVFTARP